MTLPPGIRSRIVPGVNGLEMHVLEAGDPTHPALLLLHGFPELAYSWRKIMQPLAAAGYHVIAPDQRGYGRTTGWDGAYDTDLLPFRLLNLARDVVTLVSALGHRSVAGLVGHDFGSPVTSICALVRPDMFRRVALMSAPFTGPPSLPAAPADDSLHADLARLDPPRKHYQWYYATREANPDMWQAPQGLHAFLRAYYHVKSADWPGNAPTPLRSASAAELARMPHYYIMPLDLGMAATVAPFHPSAPAEPSMCPPSSSPVRATGAPIRCMVRWSGCNPKPAPAWPAGTKCPAPAIGCSRNNRNRSPSYCSDS
jgi:pimeloyl-ACP methyl ester carboxylesterase